MVGDFSGILLDVYDIEEEDGKPVAIRTGAILKCCCRSRLPKSY